MDVYWKVVVDEKSQKMVAKVGIPENYSVNTQKHGIVDCLAYHIIGFYRQLASGQWIEDETTTVGFTFASPYKIRLKKGTIVICEHVQGFGMHAFDSLENPWLSYYMTR